MDLLIDLPKIRVREFMRLVFLLMSIFSIASADVSLNNGYATIGSDACENIYLHGMDYENAATITSTSFSANSKATPAEMAIDRRFEDSAYMKTIEGTQGAGLMVDANNLNYTRSMGGGEYNSIVFSYLAESGSVQADYFTPITRFMEDIELINNSYKGDFAVFNSKGYSMGTGNSTGESQSSLRHNINMNFLDKFSNIIGTVDTKENSGPTPLKYEWTSYSTQRDYALSGLNIKFTSGNRSATSSIAGTSSLLDPKFSPDQDEGIYDYPFDIDEHGRILLKDGVGRIFVPSRSLFMQYRLNQTGIEVEQSGEI